MTTDIQTKETLDILGTAYRVFDTVKPSRTRTFMETGRKMLTADFSARGIYEVHKIQFYDYMTNHFSNPESKINAIALHGQEAVMNFLNTLDGIIQADADMKMCLDEVIQADRKDNAVQVKTQVDEALAEINGELAENNVIEPEQAKSVEELTKPKEVQTATPVMDQKEVAPVAKPTHGLGFDLAAVTHNASVEFLMSEKAGIMQVVKDKIEKDFFKNTIVVLPKQERGAQNVVKGRLHKDFAELLEILSIENQAFLGGEAGTGKTTLAAQCAEALQLPFAHISCTAGMSEAHLLGRMIADGSYISSKFVELYENGGVFLADEVDAADANTLLVLNSALANGYISVPNRASNPTAKRHDDFHMICAANTFGNGSSEYAGREIMDAAFMDRFVLSKIHVQYDTDLEREIAKGHDEVIKAIYRIRENVKKHKIRRVVSTRLFNSAAKALKKGVSQETVFKRFFVGWTAEEIAKATSI